MRAEADAQCRRPRPSARARRPSCRRAASTASDGIDLVADRRRPAGRRAASRPPRAAGDTWPGGRGGLPQRGGRHDQAVRRERRRGGVAGLGGVQPIGGCGDPAGRRDGVGLRRILDERVRQQDGRRTRDRAAASVASGPLSASAAASRARSGLPPGGSAARLAASSSRVGGGRSSWLWVRSRLTTISPAPAAASRSTAVGQGRARRRPGPELGHGGIVGQDQHDLAAGRLGAAQAKAPVQRLQLERRQHVAVAVAGVDREDGEGDEQGREQPRPQARAVARAVATGSDRGAGNGILAPRRTPDRRRPSAARRARHRCPRRGAARRRHRPGRRTVTSPTIDSTPVPLAVLSTSHSVERTEATAVRVSISIERPPSTRPPIRRVMPCSRPSTTRMPPGSSVTKLRTAISVPGPIAICSPSVQTIRARESAPVRRMSSTNDVVARAKPTIARPADTRPGCPRPASPGRCRLAAHRPRPAASRARPPPTPARAGTT